jgi:hypothetical protein
MMNFWKGEKEREKHVLKCSSSNAKKVKGEYVDPAAWRVGWIPSEEMKSLFSNHCNCFGGEHGNV